MGRGKSKDELIQSRQSTNPQVASNLMSSMGDTSTSSRNSVSKRKKKSKGGSPELVSMTAFIHNTHELHKIRVFSSIASGTAAGILDLKGIYGFALFVIVFVITLLFMLIKMKMSINKYFRPPSKFITASLWDATTSFVLFWTFFANVLYLYG